MTLPSIVSAARRLGREAGALRFGPPVAYVYNPIEYARLPHERYLQEFGTGRKRIVLLGMNPGPWGMAQTGVPFGEITMVTEWLRIRAPVGQAPPGHPRVPIRGFDCARHEVSGTRLWGWLKGRYGTAAAMARELFVSNYCPLMFLDAAGRNLTPDRIARADQPALFEVCDRFLLAVLKSTAPEWLVGVGKFAEGRARAATQRADLDVKVISILHPSPANPQSNKDWAATVMGTFFSERVF